MAKRFIEEVQPNCNLYIDDTTGLAWIEDGSTGTRHSAHPNIHITGSVKGMKERGLWNQDDKIIPSHGWQYNISKFVCTSDLDKIAADYCRCEECLKRRGEA